MKAEIVEVDKEKDIVYIALDLERMAYLCGAKSE